MLDKLTTRLSHAFRGLNEVKTDEQGKKLILDAKKSMREVWTHREAYIDKLEYDNMQMGFALHKQDQREFEFDLLKRALKNTVAIDELETKINGSS